MTTRKQNFNEQEIQFIRNNYKKMPIKKIAAQIGKGSGTVRRFIRTNITLFENFNIPAGPNTQQQTGKMPVIQINLTHEESKIVMNIKTNKLFEEYLKTTRTLKQSDRILGGRRTGWFYNSPLYPVGDDINADPIIQGEINLGLLRLVGISDGMTFESNQLISEEQLKSAVTNFIKKFKRFYNSSVNKSQITGVVFESPRNITEQVVKNLVVVSEESVESTETEEENANPAA